MNHDVFALTLPSRAEHLGTARSFAAAVARHFALTGEAVEDLKIAISEACVDALSAGEPILVRAAEVGRAISFEIDAPEDIDAPRGPALDGIDSAARLELIRSLFPDAAVVSEDGRRAIRFSLPLG